MFDSPRVVDTPQRSQATRRRRRDGVAWALSLGFAVQAWGAAAQDSKLEVNGMTFSASREDGGEIVLSSSRAEFETDTQQALLFDVNAHVALADGEVPSFSLVCDQADLNIDTSDFRAKGHVRGVTASGEHYSADWVGFDPDADLLYSDSPVEVTNGATRLRGDGFRYHLVEDRLKLLGNVSVVHRP